MKYIGFLIATTFMTGCVSPVISQRVSLENTSDCCSSIQELEFTSLVSGTPVRTELSGSTNAFKFDEGRSRFVAYKLPSLANSDRTVVVKTFFRGVGTITGHVYCYTATFLDANRAPIKTQADERFKFQASGLIEPAYWWQTLPIPREADYLVIHSISQNRESSLQFSNTSGGFIFYAGSTYSYVPRANNMVETPCAAEGMIEVNAQ